MNATHIDWLDADSVASLAPEHADKVQYMAGNGYGFIISTDDAGEIFLCADVNGATFAVFRLMDPADAPVDEVTTDDRELAVSTLRTLVAKYL